ncbi:glycosyl hydrolase 115 family protein [Schleiferilactobacillus harbinensis]|uniref:glycosyl hydrolase 115 family protein n=1 Tax=Schleiferilactobacillus harbinensis TaxID=304207 RepID=UPI0021A8012F|nr:glycosyl hydrolase 115 family protein [Schleiferilactobacillus harbinensis]
MSTIPPILPTGTLQENIALLRRVLKVQNQLMREEVNPDLSQVPRQLVSFNEVQDFLYGDQQTPGLIDDAELADVTIMLSDSNVGYMRVLPSEKYRHRAGGWGMYYHIDMHGGPMSYEWIGSTALSRIWDQMSTAYDANVREIWIVNAGDVATQELPLAYLLDMAYDMDRYGSANRIIMNDMGDPTIWGSV